MLLSPENDAYFILLKKFLIIGRLSKLNLRGIYGKKSFKKIY